MGLGEQAKTLTKGQVDAVLGYLAKTRWPTRNRVILLLSVKAGLRAKEIACLTWRMVTDAGGQIGQVIRLENKASKGQSGRVIPMNDELRTALVEYSKTVYLPDSASWSRARGQRGFPRKPWSTCSGAGTSTSALTAARVTPDVALSNQCGAEVITRSEDRFETSRCLPGTRTFEPRRVTSRPMRRRRYGSWIWFRRDSGRVLIG
jgi:hypothetical protein